MIFITIRMHVFPEKRKEFLQTLRALTQLMIKKKGCTECRLYMDVDEENVYSLFKCWASQVDLKRYLRSEDAAVLRGVMSFLTKQPEIHSFSKENILELKTLLPSGY